MKNKKKILLLALPALLLPQAALAHCPLCTIGAGGLAVFAAWLGVNTITIGLFIGAFALALGLWIGRLIPKKYIPHQTKALAALSFLTIALPLLPMMQDYTSIYVSLGGEYGSLFNRTYLINRFLLGSLIGAGLLLLAPFISKKLVLLRKGRLLPFQGIGITIFLLLGVSAVIELTL